MVGAANGVDRLTEQMRTAGARVTKEPVDAEFFTGRSAYLCDPEGNYFEIAWADEPDNPVLAATRPAPPGPEPPAGRMALGLSHSGHRQRGSLIALRHKPIRHSEVSGT